MTNSSPSAPLLPADDGQPIGAGGSYGTGPTPDEIAAFELALAEARARFLAAALAEDGMPISAGWRGPEAEPKAIQPKDESPNHGIASTPR